MWKKRYDRLKTTAAALLFAALCLLAACGADPGPAETEAAASNGTEAPVDDTAARVYTETTTAPATFISDVDADFAEFLSALSAGHADYKTTFTAEEGAAYVEAHLQGNCPAVFSENGHAMAAYAADFGMSQTQYRIYYTADFGETWKQYTGALNVAGSIGGMVSDGAAYWAYGFASAYDDSFLICLTEQMTEMPEPVFLRDFAKTVLPDAQQIHIYSCRFDAQSQLLAVEIGTAPNRSGDLAPAARLLLTRGLAPDSVELTTGE